MKWTTRRQIVAGIAIGILLGWCATALAQSVSPNGASVTSTGATASVALPASNTAFPSLLITPALGNTVSAHYALGSSSVAATAANPVLPNGGICVPNVGPATYLAVYTGTGTATINLTQINTCPNFSGLNPSNGAAPTGPAGGDLAGTYPNPSVVSFNGGTPFGTAAGVNTGTSGATIPLLNASNTFSAMQTVSFNSGALPTSISNTVIRAANVNSSISRIVAEGYGAIGALTVARADGTAASPTGVQSGDQIGGFNSYAWGSNAAWNGSIASFRIYAAENISGTAWGSKACIGTTAVTTTTLTDSFCQGNDGGVTIGSPTGGDQGAGTLNATGLYINGTSVGAGTFLPLAGGTMSGNINMGGNAISNASTVSATGVITAASKFNSTFASASDTASAAANFGGI